MVTDKLNFEDITDSDASKLVDWVNPPSLADLKKDYDAAQSAHSDHILNVERWLSALKGDQVLKTKKGRSKIVPKLVRKQAEWRYAALSEPFLSTDDLFNTAPATFEDKQSATQNGLVLNYQINCKINKTKFIDEYIRAAVDEGTVIVRVDWEYEEGVRKVYQDVMEQQQVMSPDGTPMMQEVKVGEEQVEQTITIKNQPALEICDYRNVIIDPTCNGEPDNAEFIIYSFESSISALKKDGRYENLDNVNLESTSILSESDHNLTENGNFTFNDDARKKIIVREYWGFWDIHNKGEVTSFVAAWIGNTLIRLTENPYPDKALPFVTVQYLPKRKSIYGEPDAELLEDNQRVIGAVTRGIIDVIGRSANGQQGITKDALDVTNTRKFERGDDYKINAGVNPSTAFHMETYPEIPRSALEVLSMQNNEAESLSGVKSFSSGISGSALGVTATGIRSALDATSKRELGILRRLSDGLNRIGRKIISMNAEFLDDDEIIRVTNEEFVAINRNDLGGKYDIKLNVSTAESDEQKASELAFMLQTNAPGDDPRVNQRIKAELFKLRGMPELAKWIEEYKPEPDPMVQQMRQLEMQMLQAKIANETAKAEENKADISYKTARTRNMQSKSDLEDLKFVEQESSVNEANKEQQTQQSHENRMKEKEHDRLSELDKVAFNTLNGNRQ